MSSDQHRKKGDGARSSDSDGSEERKHYSEQGRHGRENVKRSNHDDERRRSSPKQPKHVCRMCHWLLLKVLTI